MLPTSTNPPPQSGRSTPPACVHVWVRGASEEWRMAYERGMRYELERHALCNSSCCTRSPHLVPPGLEEGGACDKVDELVVQRVAHKQDAACKGGPCTVVCGSLHKQDAACEESPCRWWMGHCARPHTRTPAPAGGEGAHTPRKEGGCSPACRSHSTPACVTLSGPHALNAIIIKVPAHTTLHACTSGEHQCTRGLARAAIV